MDLTAFAEALERSGIAEWLRGSLKALPIIEAVHVMAVAIVFGTVVIMDLRLLGYPDTRRPFTRFFRELNRWTLPAFAVAAATGALLFVPNATTYIRNTPFAFKMAALALAGVNLAIFQFGALRSVAAWDKDVPVPMAGRVAGVLSLVLWTAVIVLGRWIGFTKGYDFSVPDEIDLDFDFLQGCLRCLDRLG